MNQTTRFVQGKNEYILLLIVLTAFRLTVPIFNYVIRGEVSQPSLVEPFLYLLLLFIPYTIYRWMVGFLFAAFGAVGFVLVIWGACEMMEHLDEQPVSPWLIYCLAVFSIVEMAVQTYIGCRLFLSANVHAFLDASKPRSVTGQT